MLNRNVGASLQSVLLLLLFVFPSAAADPEPTPAEQKIIDEAVANYRDYREKAAAKLQTSIAATKSAIDTLEANDRINVIEKNRQLSKLKLNLMQSEQLLTRPGQWDAPVLDLPKLKKKGTWGRFHSRMGDAWELHNPQTVPRGVNGAVVSGVMKIKTAQGWAPVGPYSLVFENINGEPEGQVHVCVGTVRLKGVTAPKMFALPEER